MTRSGFSRLFIFCCLLLATHAYAGDSAKAGQFFEDALGRFERGDAAGAVVQLKNALQQDSRLLQAHVLLGRAQLKLGNPAGAETAFDSALSLGADRAEIAPQLAEVYFAQGKFKELAERISTAGLPANIQQDLLLLRAYAYMEMGELAKANGLLDQAGKFAKTADYLVARGMLSLQQRQLAAARGYADQALALDAHSGKAWNLRGSIEHLQGAPQNALQSYAKALEYLPALADARVARAGLLLDLNRIDELGKELAAIKANNPEDPRGTYLDSVYLSRKGKDKEAKAALLETARLIGALPPEAVKRRGQFLMLGALANYGLNSSAKAQEYLESYLKLHPDQAGPRKLLASLYLRDRQVDAAVTVLEQAAKLAPNDPDVLSLLASAYLAQKQPGKAADLLERAGSIVQRKPELAASLGFGQIGVGKIDSGLQHITQAFRQRPSDGRLGAALVMLHIQRGQALEAVGVAEALLRASKQAAPAYNLLGVAKAAANDHKGARAAYEKALSLDPKLDAARLNLGKLETADGHADAARQQFALLIKRNPRHSQAQFELARTDAAAGNLGAAIERLEKLRSIDAGTNIALTLADYYLADNQAAKALEVAKDLSGRNPDDYQALSLLGRSHAASGHLDLAKAAFRDMSRQADFNVVQLAETARLQLRLGDLDSAALSLNKALSVTPDDLAINLLLAERDLRKGAYEPAQSRVQQVIARQPASAEPYRLLGDIASARGRSAEAVQHYRAALNKADTSDNALRLYQSQTQAGDLARALSELDDWNRRHPNVATTQSALAEGWLRAGKLDQARAGYERLLKQHGEHAPELNNLANILLKQRDLKGALKYAERACQLAPDSPITNDTLGWVLVLNGETDRSLRYLRDARLRAPNILEIHYHLAVALQRSGRAAEASRELDLALNPGTAFEGIAEARQLRLQLRKP
jgi:putative PEP-CTERM system TPR-repeat lipoprotein